MTEEKLQSCLDLLLAEKEQNSQINEAYERKGDEMAVKQVDGKDIIGKAEIGVALLNTDVAIMGVTNILRNMENHLSERQENMEMLLNGRVPPKILTGMDIKVECLDQGRRESVKVLECNQYSEHLACKLELLQKGKGIIAYKAVPIPYFHNGKGLQVKLDHDTFYKENTGKTFDLSNCKVEEGQARCDTFVSTANDCLEKLHSSGGEHSR